MRKLVGKHGSGKGDRGADPERGGRACGVFTGAPLTRVADSVSAGELQALNLLRDRYLVLLQQWSHLGWVPVWRVGKACMRTP